jgi:DNA-binding winged helix-turn-helix (wHTH) protein
MSDNLFLFDTFSLDANERVLVRDGKVVPLPAKALSTLLVLVRNTGHVVEKDVLMKEVWPDEFVEEGNLAQHIYILRKALGESTESPRYLETIPRRGYRFMAQMLELSRKYASEISSVAVLPFVNTSNDPKIEYISDGITESTTNSLSLIPRLKVIAYSIAFRYRGSEPREAGHSLGVNSVILGFVKQVGEHLIVSAELIDVADGSRIWGEHYKRQFIDTFSSQEELALEISERIRLRLMGELNENGFKEKNTSNILPTEMFREIIE